MIAVLFARADSVYKRIPDCDVYDIERDALTFPGGMPVVAHPPCRSWGRLSHLARPRDGEAELARWAVDQVRTHGGILEHPATSRLWSAKQLPSPGQQDLYGGWTLGAYQWWWGHKAQKATRFYICGVRPQGMPPMPYRMGDPEYVVAQSRRNPGKKKEITKPEREMTPQLLAEWLCEVARRCEVSR